MSDYWIGYVFGCVGTAVTYLLLNLLFGRRKT